jgi:diguanylate cyclase (GGDEF)-like protein
MVLTPDGEVAYWNQPGPAPKLLQSDFFQIHSQETLRELFVGAPGPSLMQADRWMFGVSRAARDEDGALVRVLAAIIDLEYLHQLNRSLSAPPASILTISSAQGVVYSRIPEPDLFVGRRLSGIAERASLVASTLALRHKSSLDGKDYLVAAHKVGSFPLVAMVARPEEAVLKPWRHDRLIFVVWGLFSGLLILLMTLRTATYQRNQTRTRKTLHQQAITDPLTAIFNRRYAVEQAQLEIRKGQRTGGNLSFVLLDLDHFKSVNDGYGHDAGDRVLIAIARILKEICRSTDIVSRFGGEEFLLVLPGTDLEGAMVIAEKIRLALEKQNHHYSGKTFQVTASFGVSQWMVDEADIREVLLRTDDALYQVKSNGRNQIRSAPARSTPGRAPGMVSWRYDGL